MRLLVYNQGIRVAVRSFPTRAEAEVWHDVTKADFKAGKPAVEIAPEVAKPDETFGWLVGRYLDEGMERLKKSSQQSRLTRLQFFRGTPFDSTLMTEFIAKTVDDWVSWFLRHPSRKNPGRKSFLHELKYLSVILNWYLNYLNPNFVGPVVRRHRERVFFKPVSARRPDYFMKPEEIIRSTKWLREHRSNPVYWQLAIFLMLTGVRVGEACGLCWDAVDLDSRVVRINRTVMWDHWTRTPTLVDTTKTEESARLSRSLANWSTCFEICKLAHLKPDLYLLTRTGGSFVTTPSNRRLTRVLRLWDCHGDRHTFVAIRMQQ